MTYDELKAEALRQGYKLVAIEPRPLLMKEAFPNHGTKWTQDDRAAIAVAYQFGEDLYKMSDMFGRTPGSIAFVLEKMNLLRLDILSQALFDTKTGKFVANGNAMRAFVNNRMKI